MERPLTVFNEYKEVCPPGAGEDDPCEAGTQVVERPQQFADDKQLPQYFFTTAGGSQGWVCVCVYVESKNECVCDWPAFTKLSTLYRRWL